MNFDRLHGKKCIWHKGDLLNNKIYGKLYVTGSSLFVCQNVVAGAPAPNLFGFRHSYYYSIKNCNSIKDVMTICRLEILGIKNKKFKI